MKILWISPMGDALAQAAKALDEGNKVVAYTPLKTELPSIRKDNLWAFAKAADLVVLDGSFPLERTRRSWKPSQDALFFDELRRKHAIPCLGPTPTLDLIVQDERYLRKWCQRLGIAYAPMSDAGERFDSAAWFIGNDIVPPGPLLAPWKPIFKAVGFRGWFGLSGWTDGDGVHVSRATTAWPVEALPEQLTEFLWRMNNG